MGGSNHETSLLLMHRGMSRTCLGMSQDTICTSTVYIIFFVVFFASPASSHQKEVELHHAFSSTPFTEGEGVELKTELTSCQIGGIGYPRTVHGNPRHIHSNAYTLSSVTWHLGLQNLSRSVEHGGVLMSSNNSASAHVHTQCANVAGLASSTAP